MFFHTDNHISLDEPQRAIGKNTRDAMRSGIMFGAAAMLDGLLDRMEQELGTPATVVATGGISKFVVPLCRRKLIYDRTLMLKGTMSFMPSAMTRPPV